MKLCTKRIYCTSCRTLVDGREQRGSDNTTRVLCSKCGRLLYIWNGIGWRYVPQGK